MRCRWGRRRSATRVRHGRSCTRSVAGATRTDDRWPSCVERREPSTGNRGGPTTTTRGRRSEETVTHDAVTESFAARVAGAVTRTGPVCAGIDPWRELLLAWGLDDDVKGLRTFCQICV